MRYKSFLSILFLAAAGFVLCSPAAAQSRVSRIYRPCSGSTTPASVSIDRAGNITIAPCSGKTLTSPGVPLTSQLLANNNVSGTTALAGTQLSVTVPAAGNYEIDLIVHATEGPGGLRFDFSGTATVGYFIGQWTGHYVDLAYSSSSRITSPGTGFRDSTFTGRDTIYLFRGSVEFTSGGTFFLRFAQDTSNGFQSTLERGSTLKLTKMN
jgi:hypothetical protein